jgi:signal transduction histidine kinase/CheY-like chemotaxis protein
VDATREGNFYRELFELSPDAILVIEGDRFVDCNPAAVRMLRFASKAELLARYSGDTEHGGLRAHPGEFSPPRQPDGRDSFEKANEMIGIAFERGNHRFEWEHVRADGEVFPVEVQLTVVRRGENPTLHVVWREIGERKRLEAELRQAQRLEAVGRLAGGIAHDFNNLLVVILSHAELLDQESPADGPSAEHAREIRLAADRAAALTRQLLAFSRGQPIQPRPTDLGRLVAHLAGLLRRLIGEHIELGLDLPEEGATVEVDPSQLEQLVINLAANARDAMPGGGRIEIAVRRCEREGRASAGELPPGPYVALRVSDTGKGMSRNELDHAFDPFFTTKPQGEGAGLGLATVHAIAKQNRGTARITSPAGAGTTVEVLLPWCDAPPVEFTARPPARRSAGGGETVLVVEDEQAIRKLLQSVLEREGYRVLTARDGAEALDLVGEHEQTIDLLLTDVVMPRVSGPELVRRLSKIRRGFKVMYMSGYSHEGPLSGITVGEEAEVLAKPFSPSQLLAEVRSVLDGR